MQLANEPRKLVTDYSHGMQKKLALAAAVIHGPKILFLDEPFEGVDAIAAGTLKSMLQGMIARGATIFLTSHVLEIVERLCSHVAIIDRGVLVAQGSLEELRAGVESQAPGEAEAEPTGKLTLEEIFLHTVGGVAFSGTGAFLAGLAASSQSRGQLAAIASVRWQIFLHSLRSKRGALELFSRIVIGAVITGGGLGGADPSGWTRLVFRLTKQTRWTRPAVVASLSVLADFSFDGYGAQRIHRFDKSFALSVSYRTYVMVRLVYGALDPATVLGTFWLVGIMWGLDGLAPACCLGPSLSCWSLPSST